MFFNAGRMVRLQHATTFLWSGSDVCYEKSIFRKKYSVFSAEETIRRAKERLGEEKYNLVTNNCEHFAMWCKTGESVSGQVK